MEAALYHNGDIQMSLNSFVDQGMKMLDTLSQSGYLKTTDPVDIKTVPGLISTRDSDFTIRDT